MSDAQRSDNFSLDMVIGRRIRLLRALRGLTLADVASRLGVSSQQLQKYETGVNRVSAGRLFEMAELLDCEVSEFFQDLRGNLDDADTALDLETLHLARMLQALPDASMRDSLRALVETLQEPKSA